MMAFEWMTPDQEVQVVYSRQSDGTYRINLAGTEQAVIISRAKLLDLIPGVSPRTSLGCSQIWDEDAAELFGEMAVAI